MNDHYAIIIGIDNYGKMDDDSSFESLTSAVKDASAFMEWLVSPDGGAIDNDPTPSKRRIIPIFSPPVLKNQVFPTPMEATPIKDQIDNALIEFGFTKNNGRIGKRLYFYFSGHGIAVSSDDVAMMMANAFRTMESRNIGLKNYRKYLQERYLFDEVVFIADCCRSRVTKPIDLGNPAFVTDRDMETPDVNDLVILAAEYGDPSYAVTGGQGLLTQALLEGLKGDPGALDQMGRVTSHTLNNFLPKRVKALAQQNLVKQTPEMNTFRNEIILCKPRKTVRIQVVADARIRGEIIICDGEDREIQRQKAELATRESPWEVDLFDSLIPYRVKVSNISHPLILELGRVKEDGNVFQIQ